MCFLVVVIPPCSAHVFVGECDAVVLEPPWELVVGSESDFPIKDCSNRAATVVLEMFERALGYIDRSKAAFGDPMVVAYCDELQEFCLVGYSGVLHIARNGEAVACVPLKVVEVVEHVAL